MIIYKITNKVNGMMYIGQTKRSLNIRWHQHCNDAKNEHSYSKMKDAINEFGADSFTVEQIDSASTKEEANEKEMHWIKFYNSTVEGYNKSIGGKNSGANKKVKCVETDEVFDSISEACKAMGFSNSAIAWALSAKHRKCGGFHWVRV